MKLLARCLALAIFANTLGCSGHRAIRKNTTETDTLLRTVSYETPATSAPSAPPPQPTAELDPHQRASPVRTRASLSEKAGSLGEFVGDGLKATAAFVSYGVFKIALATLGLDDDKKEDSSTPRARADRNLNQWIDERDRWERDNETSSHQNHP